MSLLAINPVSRPVQTLAGSIDGAKLASAAATSKTPVNVKDSLAGLNLADLHKNIKNIISINVTDTGRLSFSASDLSQYADVIGKISGNRDLSVTDVSTSALSGVLKNKNVKEVAIRDTTAHIEASMGTMLANQSKITAVTRSDSAVGAGATMKITDANLMQANVATANNLLSKFKLTGGVADTTIATKLNVSGASVSRLSTLTTLNVNSVGISDTVSNIVKNTNSLTAGIAKIATIHALPPTSPISITATDYDSFKAATAVNTKLSTDNPKSLNNAFSVTGVTAARAQAMTGATVATATDLAADTHVKTIAVNDTTAIGIANLSTKVSRVDLTLTSGQQAGAMRDLVALGKTLGRVKVSDADTVTMDVANIKDKATAAALGKMTGQSNNVLALNVTGAKLADMPALLANKQVNTAAVTDSVDNLLNFSSDSFSTMPKGVSITIADTAANVTDNKNALIAAFTSANPALGLNVSATNNIKLSVSDTVDNLSSHIDDLQAVANAISSPTSASNSPSNIEIHQVLANGAADTTGMIKVDLGQYTADKGILDLAKATPTTQNVEIDFGTADLTAGTPDLRALTAAKQAGYNALQHDTMVLGAAAPISTVDNGVTATRATNPTNNPTYADVGKFDLTITVAGSRASALYTAIQGDADLKAFSSGTAGNAGGAVALSTLKTTIVSVDVGA